MPFFLFKGMRLGMVEVKENLGGVKKLALLFAHVFNVFLMLCLGFGSFFSSFNFDAFSEGFGLE